MITYAIFYSSQADATRNQNYLIRDLIYSKIEYKLNKNKTRLSTKYCEIIYVTSSNFRSIIKDTQVHIAYLNHLNIEKGRLNELRSLNPLAISTYGPDLWGTVLLLTNSENEVG